MQIRQMMSALILKIKLKPKRIGYFNNTIIKYVQCYGYIQNPQTNWPTFIFRRDRNYQVTYWSRTISYPQLVWFINKQKMHPWKPGFSIHRSLIVNSFLIVLLQTQKGHTPHTGYNTISVDLDKEACGTCFDAHFLLVECLVQFNK